MPKVTPPTAALSSAPQDAAKAVRAGFSIRSAPISPTTSIMIDPGFGAHACLNVLVTKGLLTDVAGNADSVDPVQGT